MELTVTEKGVLIPKQWLKGVKEVEVFRENHLILIIPKRTPTAILQLSIPAEDNIVTPDENARPDAEYQAAMQSYLSRGAYLSTDKEKDYPKRETLYDRDIMVR
jgi:hypothetical protein